MRYDDDFDTFEPDYDSGEGSGTAPWEEPSPSRLSKREIHKKRKLERKLRRLEERERLRSEEPDEEPRMTEDEPRRRSKLEEAIKAFMTGNILSSAGVIRTYPYLVFIAFLAFLYIGNIFSMQRLHRQQAALTREVRELRTKSMTIASECMQATRQSNIIREIEKRGIPLKESLEPNRVIPEK